MFGRATIRLGIGPHSSFILNLNHYVVHDVALLVMTNMWSLLTLLAKKSSCHTTQQPAVFRISHFSTKHCNFSKNRVVTNPEKRGNLEYSGNSLNLENSWNSHGILRNLREQ